MCSKPVLHVEALLHPHSTIRYDVIRKCLDQYLQGTKIFLVCFQEIRDYKDVDVLRENLERVWIAECAGSTKDVHSPKAVSLAIHVYQLNQESAVEEYDEDDNNGDGSALVASHWVLPSKGLVGVWESLIFDDGVQTRLLDYVSTMMLFSEKCVDANIISWNRVLLLHGPPGTGKTSLCRGLAQKLSIRLAESYSHGKLLEINSHSLFSKWFSESGKLVQKLFAQIWELVDDEDAFVCVLIDEVESLAAVRKSALSGNEPSDAIRVVNALLTQIDKLRQKKNVLILTTSNITEAIDLAFIDRADIKLYIGLPKQKAIYSILFTCTQELMRVGIISPTQSIMDWRRIEAFYTKDTGGYGDVESRASRKLYEISQSCLGMSGRGLRKLPFLAHAFFLQAPIVSLGAYLQALEFTVKDEKISREYFEDKNATM